MSCARLEHSERNRVSRPLRPPTFPKILDLKPDLVLTFSDLQADIAATLIRHGIEVHGFNQRTISEILDMVMALGALTGATDRAWRLAQELATSVAGVREQAARLPRQPKVAGPWRHGAGHRPSAPGARGLRF